MDERISIKVLFELFERELRVSYAVSNHADVTAYLLNRLFDITPESKLRPDRVLVELDRSEIVHLSKRIPDLPANRKVLAPYCPYVSPVLPGTQYEEKFMVPVPIETWQPPGYGILPVREKPVRREFDGMDFRVDFYWSAEGVTEKQATIGDDSAVIPVFPAGIRPKFGSLRSEVFRTKVAVLDPRT
jgi:hypothetical protein